MDENNAVREELVEWITKPGNEDLLETLKLMKESGSLQEDWYEGLTDDERGSIKKGQEDLKEGRSLSSKEFWEKHG